MYHICIKRVFRGGGKGVIPPCLQPLMVTYSELVYLRNILNVNRERPSCLIRHLPYIQIDGYHKEILNSIMILQLDQNFYTAICNELGNSAVLLGMLIVHTSNDILRKKRVKLGKKMIINSKNCLLI